MVKKRLNKKILMIFMLSILIFLTGYSKITYAAGSGSTAQSGDEENRLFDPFTLTSIGLTLEDGTVVSRPPIRINTRPTVRSYFRPTLIVF